TSIASVNKDVAVANVVLAKFFAADAATTLTGLAVAIFTMGLVLSSLGSLHTSILAGARVPYAMARDRQFFSRFGTLSINGVPIASLILQGAWAILLILSDSLWRLYDKENALFDTLTNYVVFGSFIFYALITSTVFIFRKRYPDAERPYKTFGYPVVPVIFLLVTAWLLIQTLYDDTANSLIGIGLILLGLPVYYYLNSRNKQSETENGDQ
ncbi:MAG TPA: APC family permease, partial [Pyrinomonadaceae bacterium]|nr:APC family permease [Pyrinomonadaceae bacterium]